MSTAEERRLVVRNKYRTIIGRNIYSQEKRNYCYKPYTNGKYYSDCSSSISWTYKEVGENFGILNTVGMYNSSKLKTVNVPIKNGQIQDVSMLRIGDMLLFAGKDKSRKSAGYVGHVEMVGEISGNKVTLYGHGSGNPKKHEMVAYCKTRYNTKTSTPLGRALLIKVKRFIQDDDNSNKNENTFTNIKKGDSGSRVKEIQEMLKKINNDFLPKYGVDSDFGSETENAVKTFQKDNNLDSTGVVDEKTYNLLKEKLGLNISNKKVKITGASVFIRDNSNAKANILGIAYKNELYDYNGKTSDDGWNYIKFNNENAWVSGKYSQVINE